MKRVKRLLCLLLGGHKPELRVAAYDFKIESASSRYPREQYPADIFPFLPLGLRVTDLRMDFKTLCARCEVEIGTWAALHEKGGQ